MLRKSKLRTNAGTFKERPWKDKQDILYIKAHIPDENNEPLCKGRKPLVWEFQFTQTIEQVTCKKCFRAKTGRWPHRDSFYTKRSNSPAIEF